jgi:hypothetical protein
MLRAVMRRPRRRQEATRLPILPRDRDLVPNLHKETHERSRRRQEATRLPILPRDRDLVPNLHKKTHKRSRRRQEATGTGTWSLTCIR